MASGLLEQPVISVGTVVGADQWKVRWMKTVIEKCVIWNYAHGSYLEIESLEKAWGPMKERPIWKGIARLLAWHNR